MPLINSRDILKPLEKAIKDRKNLVKNRKKLINSETEKVYNYDIVTLEGEINSFIKMRSLVFDLERK